MLGRRKKRSLQARRCMNSQLLRKKIFNSHHLLSSRKSSRRRKRLRKYSLLVLMMRKFLPNLSHRSRKKLKRKRMQLMKKSQTRQLKK
jgi:hypothetical protein